MDQGKKLNIVCLQFKSCMLSEGFKGDLRHVSKKNVKKKKLYKYQKLAEIENKYTVPSG